jgi:two-component system chemotaxis response regulator CheY
MSCNVLIVDDAPFIREALMQICHAAGHWIVGEASNGIEAVRMTAQLRPDVIIIDLVMPEKNGIEAIHEIHEMDPEVRIIACSSADQEFLKLKAEIAGAHAFLAKPFTRENVIAIIKEVRPKLKARRG